MVAPMPKDATWVRQSFLLAARDASGNLQVQLDKVDADRRFFTSASLKWGDTTLGGNAAINPLPQFTRFADVRVQGRTASQGMGRYYSEAIDDHQQVIHMRFGLPQFNSLTQFFSSFYNSGAGQLARTGRATRAFYLIGKAAAFVVSVFALPLLALHFTTVGLRFFFNKPSSKFYYSKPAMPLYWNSVQTIVNHIAVNRGIIPRFLGGNEGNDAYKDGYEFDKAGLQELNKLLPDIMMEDGGVNVYAMATRYQRLERQHHKLVEEALHSAQSATNFDDMKKLVAGSLGSNILQAGAVRFADYMAKWLAGDQSKPSGSTDKKDAVATEGMGVDAQTGKPKEPPGYFDYAAAELDDGSMFASFRVNSTGAVSESFSNSVGESGMREKINSMSSDSRETNFNLANGNISDSMVGKIIGAVGMAVKSAAEGAADMLNISGIAALGGACLVDIPKHWQSSTANLTRQTYSMTLSSPYGNPVSQLINIYVPLAMLLAGALPLATGKQSYTSPFLVELYDKGRQITRLGMIDSLSITRGTSNLGFNQEGHAMAIDVSFSVVDMSSILYMPVSEGFTFNPATGIFDEDTVFSDYMAVLSGMSLADNIYQSRKFKLNVARKLAQWRTYRSKAHIAMVTTNGMWPTRLLSTFFRGTGKS